MFLVDLLITKIIEKLKKMSIMETIIKYIASMIIVIVWLLFSIAETSYCQNTKADKDMNNDKGIVHNDKTGIVIDILDNSNQAKTVRVSDVHTGEKLVSIPTKLSIIAGSHVVYRKLSGSAHSSSNANANSHGDNQMCEIISVKN